MTKVFEKPQFKKGMIIQPQNASRFKVIRVDDDIIYIQPFLREPYNNWSTELTVCSLDDLAQAIQIDGYVILEEGTPTIILEK